MTCLSKNNERYANQIIAIVNKCRFNDYPLVRKKLLELQKSITRNRDIVYFALMHLNRLNDDPSSKEYKKSDSHILSDHAFVRILQRVSGIDTFDAKEKAYMLLLQQEKVKPVFTPRKDKIITVY